MLRSLVTARVPRTSVNPRAAFAAGPPAHSHARPSWCRIVRQLPRASMPACSSAKRKPNAPVTDKPGKRTPHRRQGIPDSVNVGRVSRLPGLPMTSSVVARRLPRGLQRTLTLSRPGAASCGNFRGHPCPLAEQRARRRTFRQRLTFPKPARKRTHRQPRKTPRFRGLFSATRKRPTEKNDAPNSTIEICTPTNTIATTDQ